MFGSTRGRSRTTPSSSSSATRSATRSCAGARARFDNFKVVPPDTGIVHQVNLEYLARVVFVDDARGQVVPRHARRHRLAHDDDQRPRRARLGRRRHRGRGGDARAADVDADPAGARLQADRRAARGRDRDRPRAHRHRDAAQARRRRQVRRVLRRGARADCRSPTARRSATCRPEFGSTCAIFPIDAETLRYLAFSRPPARADRPGRGVRQGAGPVARRGTPRSRRSPTRSSSTCRPSCRASPGPKRPQDRVVADRVQGRRSGWRSRAMLPDGGPARTRRSSRVVPGALTRCPPTSPTAIGHEPSSETGGGARAGGAGSARRR